MSYVQYFCADAQGKIVMTSCGPVLPPVGAFPDWIIFEGVANVGDWIDLSDPASDPVPRPIVTHGWAATGAAPVTLGMGTLPVSTTVTATNEAGESVTTSDPTDPIILVDSETYMVTISPPWPYLPETLTIEVT